ncbi:MULTISPECIES: PASTA domain-containing protein [Sphingobacterium]|jgi:eukaryotic-like serine/threonine-protein kinase|uniref:PASTA domain-containing protein n=1 Tax=Sphingobacterium multivorum TaxID=28454 RepID=A0A654CFK2_SPHMU|nr:MULTISPECIES: PASTA domain-containing protein [Sphingobacterium]HAE67896.1 PASTA domain-containing protein [Sphingobacterium sp.]OJZ12362.1 MAG: serine/threonine protein kinase [Sphingobacterium sp. 40-24]QQT44433.1 PASTA domain-containing protein [Sphingobacterium multivorum]QQT62812.1 PASTA domain-containing protein [Sphingobacterium multivorum]SUJ87349.1 preprotein translocase subunit SecG [Sphingobacterium multivorum]
MSKVVQYLQTPTFRKNLIAAFIAIVCLFLFVYVGLKIYTKHDESIAVPKVKGLHISAAIQALEDAGLEYQIDSVYQMDAKPGMVIEQDPEQGFHVKSGRTIYLTIITQVAPEVAFPNIKDKTLIEATAILKNHNLRIGDTSYVADIARDIVLDAQFAGQSIRNGRMIPKGSRIDLVLGNGLGANEVEIPNLIGLPLNEAKFALSGAGLGLGTVTYDPNVTDTATAVISVQSPGIEKGLTSLGAKIDITLSLTAPTTTTGAPAGGTPTPKPQANQTQVTPPAAKAPVQSKPVAPAKSTTTNTPAAKSTTTNPTAGQKKEKESKGNSLGF